MSRSISHAVNRALGSLSELLPSATRGAALSRGYGSQTSSRTMQQLLRQRLTASQIPLGRIGHGTARGPGFFTTAPNTFSTPLRRGFRFSAWRRADQAAGDASKQPQTLGARLRKLSREYGWSAVGVYLALSVLDFPFCFLLVRVVGTETIGKVEHFVVSGVKSVIPESIRVKWAEYWHAIKQTEEKELGDDEVTEKVEMASWGVAEAQERANEEASLATQLALAYAIHKSFIFLRVPITAAITPKVVKVLRSWGWNIGKRTKRSA